MVKLKALRGKVNRRKTLPVKAVEAKADIWHSYDGHVIDSRHLALSLLLPPAVKEFLQDLEREVQALCGTRYGHGKDVENQRWGSQVGSIILGGQRVRIKKPRVRNRMTKKEVKIPIYERFRDSSAFDERVVTDGLRKVSQRDFSGGQPKIRASFGFTKSSVSRRWVKGSDKQLKMLNERPLRGLDVVAVFIDGKRFRKQGVVVALGVGADGKKTVLGIFQCDTENSTACDELLRALESRGMPSRGILIVVDGGSGLNKALNERYNLNLPGERRAVRVRCYVHKWRNIEKNLGEEYKREAAALFWAIRDSDRLSMAHECSKALEGFLRRVNRSTLDSFLEAKEDLLNLHRLHLTPRLRDFFSSTNPIESLNYLTEEDLRRVKNWRDSHQFQRWLATSVLANERRMRRVMGYRGIPALQAGLAKLCFGEALARQNEALLA